MKVQKAYAEWSATYDQDRNRTRDLDEQVTRSVLEGIRCRSIVEIGCGTGKNTSFLSQLGEQVLALDFSAPMLERAGQKVTSSNVSFELADVTKRWPCEDRSADLVVCNLVLEHVPGLTPVFGEASRVLTDRGRMFVSELHPFRQYQGVQARFTRNDETMEIPAFVHHTSDFIAAAVASGLWLLKLGEWWHEEDPGKPPRLISFLFRKE